MSTETCCNSLDTGGAALLGSVLGSVLVGSVLDFVVASLVRIPHTSSLAELLLLRGVRASRQVVGWVAGPGIGGGQVAVWPSYASFTFHVTNVSYYGTKGMYVRYGTNLEAARIGGQQMCQITVEWLFDRVWPSHIRKVASLFAQALSRCTSENDSSTHYGG